jgi:starch-binding outer membrane protein, SusD/RagB family
MKRYIGLALVAGLAATACKDNPTAAPSDAPTVDALANLNRTTLQQLAIGVTAQDRSAYASTGVVILPEILARDVYRIDASEPRYVQETLGGNADPGSFAGGSGFSPFYTATRAANTVLIALRNPPPNVFSAEEISAANGFFRTMKALDFYRVIEQRDTIGIPLQTDAPREMTPVYCKPYVMSYIAALLDSANADFLAGGTTLPFTLPTSWTSHGRDYNKVANMILFNRGLKGKVDFYRAIDRAAPQPALLATSIAELTQALGGKGPGAVPTADFKTGPYYHFDPVGDQFSNPRADNKIAAFPHLIDSIPATDARRAKIVLRTCDKPPCTLSGNGLSSDYTFSFAAPTSANTVVPIPILTDEELVLLRAQAEIEAGNLADALLDINSVHVFYAPTTPYAAFGSVNAARDAVLFEKRFSLLFEGPQRLVDLRAYGYLNETHFAKQLPSDPFNSAFPLPRAELNARGVTTNPACTAS